MYIFMYFSGAIFILK